MKNVFIFRDKMNTSGYTYAFLVMLLLFGPAGTLLSQQTTAPFNEQAAKAAIREKGLQGEAAREYLEYCREQYKLSKTKLLPRKLPATFSLKTFPSLTGSANCNNIGFEDTTFANWTGATGTNINPSPTAWVPGLISILNARENDVNSRHTLMTIPPFNNDPALGPIIGYDTIAINTVTGKADIPYLCPGGGRVSVRLGNSIGNAQTEKLDYAITVSPASTLLTYSYAVVLNNATNSHTSVQQPFFKVNLLDSAGRLLNSSPCNNYFVSADSAAADPSLQFLPYNNPDPAHDGFYKKWTSVSVDLSPYMGRTVTIEYVAAACIFTLHFGYAYIDASCGALRSVSSMCSGDSTALLIAPPGYATYQWLDPSNTPIPAPLGTHDSLYVHSGHPGQVYTVNLVSFSGCPTTLKDTIQITHINALPGSMPSCFGGHDGTASVIPSGGAHGYSYQWTPGGDTTQSISHLAPGTYTVHVVGQQCGTGAFDTVVAVKALPPAAPIFQSNPICAGDTFQFHALGTGLYPVHAWYMPPNLAPAQGVGPNTPNYISWKGIGGTYVDSMRDGNGCIKVFEDSLYINTLSATIKQTPEHCWMDSVATIQLTAGGGINPVYTYTWSGPGNFTSSGDSLTNLLPGTYVYTIKNPGHNCVLKDSVRIVSPPKPADSLLITTSFCDGDTSAVLHFTSGLSPYTWFNGAIKVPGIPASSDTLFIAPPSQYTSYTLSYFSGGCKRRDSAAVRTFQPVRFLPVNTSNVFSPNTDGANDLFFPFPQEALSEEEIAYNTQSYYLRVYDRWGVEVFSTHSYLDGWDGKYQGKTASPGTYYWITTYLPRCVSNVAPIVQKGFVELVR